MPIGEGGEMSETINSIRALQPGEKLIVKTGRELSEYEYDRLVEQIHHFLESDDVRIAVLPPDMEVYILKDGDEVLLKDELNKDNP